MERVGQVTRSASALIIAKLVTSAMMFLLAIVVNRRLGPELAGVYVYAVTLYTIFQVIPDFGLGNIFIRDVSPHRGRMRGYLKNVVGLRLLLGGLSFALLALANVVATAAQRSGALSGERFWAVFVVSFSLLLEQPFSNSLAEAFIALERQTVVAYVYLLMGFLRMGLSLYVVLAGMRHAVVLLVGVYIVTILYSIFHFSLVYRRWLKREGYALALAGADRAGGGEEPPGAPGLDCAMAGEELSAPVGVDCPRAGQEPPVAPGLDCAMAVEEPAAVEEPSPFAVSMMPERVGPPPGESGARLRRYLLASAWPLAVAAGGVVLYAGLDIPMVGWVAGDGAMGLYNSGAMYAKAFMFLTIAVNMAVLPAISMVGDRRPGQLGGVWESLLRYALLLVLPLTVILPVLARPVLMIQKHEFLLAWSVVWLTMCAMNFTMLTAISYPFFIVINRQRRIVQVVAIGVAAKVCLNVAMISAFGYKGAAVTMLVTEVLAFLLIYILLSRELGHRFHWIRFAGVPALALAALYTTALLLEKLMRSDEPLTACKQALLISVIILVVYVVLVFLTGALSRRGLEELNELLKVE